MSFMTEVFLYLLIGYVFLIIFCICEKEVSKLQGIFTMIFWPIVLLCVIIYFSATILFSITEKLISFFKRKPFKFSKDEDDFGYNNEPFI